MQLQPKMTMLKGEERLRIFEPFAGLPTERTRAQSLRRFTLRIGVITVELEIGDEPIGIG
jgi:hypothetical protein